MEEQMEMLSDLLTFPNIAGYLQGYRLFDASELVILLYDREARAKMMALADRYDLRYEFAVFLCGMKAALHLNRGPNS